MVLIDTVLEWENTEKLYEEDLERDKVRSLMVGQLYPSILTSKISEIQKNFLF